MNRAGAFRITGAGEQSPDLAPAGPSTFPAVGLAYRRNSTALSTTAGRPGGAVPHGGPVRKARVPRPKPV